MGGGPSVSNRGDSPAQVDLPGAGGVIPAPTTAAASLGDGEQNLHEIESVGKVGRVDKDMANSSGSERRAALAPQASGNAGTSTPNLGDRSTGAAVVATGEDTEDPLSNQRLNEQSGAQETMAGGENGLEGDPHAGGREPFTQEAGARDAVVEVGEGGGATMAAAQERRIPSSLNSEAAVDSSEKIEDSHRIDMPPRDFSTKAEELDNYVPYPVVRTTSNFSVESATGDQCRICQQHAEEPLMELGCRCRGELAKAHRSCVNHWFGTKGTNKCEVCQHVATNVPAPSTQPAPHFWVWRVGGPYNGATLRRAAGVGPIRFSPLPVRPVLLMTLRRHPTIMLLWVLLFAFMAYLFVDVTDSASIGYAAMPIGFLFGVLVVLGLGTAARLILECWHERVIRRNIQRMEEATYEDFVVEQNINNAHRPAGTEGPVTSQGGAPAQPSPVVAFPAQVAPSQPFPPPRPATPPPSPPPPPAPPPQRVPPLESLGVEVADENGLGGAAAPPQAAEPVPSIVKDVER